MHKPRCLSATTAHGFTLIEALITMFIVSVSSVSIISLLTFDASISSIEQQRARAHQIASDQMERVREQLYSLITPGTTVTVWDNGTPGNTADDTNGTLVIRIIDPATGGVLTAVPTPARRVQVEVTVSWNPRGRLSGKTLRETVMGYLAP